MNASRGKFALALALSSLSFASVCAHAAEVPTAKADLLNAKGEKVGHATFTEAGDGIKVTVEAKGLKPGEHGIHFHETGKCEAPTFKSAGGHFALPGTEHGLRNPKGPHAGDLPNVDVKADGILKAEFTANRVTLKAGQNSLLKTGGTALVVHAGEDDQKSNPAGNSGDRALCGVIEAVK